MGAAPDGPTPQRGTTTPLVGREREQAVLRDALASALTGGGSLVLVGGEAGIGKTALAEALLAEAQERGALILVGRCYDLMETPPYGPWLEVTAQYPAGAPGLPPLPAVVADRAALAAITSQVALFERVVGWFAAVAAARPLVLLLDDLHWADPASLDLLRVVARRAPTLRLLLLVTYRSDELTRRHPLYALLPVLEREARSQRLDLRGFDAASVRTLVISRYALPDEDAVRLVAWLGGRAEGNAFFTNQLLRALEDAGALARTATTWALGNLAAVGLPVPLRQVLDARLTRLAPEAQRLLTLAAVIGQTVPLALWAAVAETDEEGLLDTIERAVEAHLVTEAADGGAVRFAHALIREALYEGLLATRRRRVHRRVAEALVAGADADADAVAYHFQRAGDGRAAAWLVAAGERAQRAYAWLTAAARYEAALALLEQQGAAPVTRARLLHTVGLLHRYADQPRSVALLAEAAALATDAGQVDLAAAARFDRGHLLSMHGDYAAGLPELRAALPLLEALPPDRLATLPTAVVLGLRPGEAYHHGVLLVYLAYSGHLAEVAAAGVEALAWGPGTSHRALGALGALHYWRGEPALAVRAYEAAGAAARAAGQHYEVGVLLTLLGLVLITYRTDDLAARAALAAEVAAVLPAAREADRDLTAAEYLGPLRLVEGTWGELAHWGATQPYRFPTDQVFLVELAQLQGDVAGAWAHVRTILPGGPTTMPGTANLLVGLSLARVAAALALEAGQLPEARAWLEARDRWLAWSGAVLGRAEGQLGWAAYHRAAGDPGQAREHAVHALAHASEPRQPLALLAAHRLLGELATDGGDHSEAAAHLAQALALAADCAAPYERALTLLALAERHAATGAQEQAMTTLAETRAILEPLEARPALARADALTARLTIPSPAATATLPFGLSAREAEVLRLVAQGLTNAQAAEQLFLSPRTIDQHLRSIYNKLGVNTRAAATAFAIDHGLR